MVSILFLLIPEGILSWETIENSQRILVVVLDWIAMRVLAMKRLLIILLVRYILDFSLNLRSSNHILSLVYLNEDIFKFRHKVETENLCRI